MSIINWILNKQGFKKVKKTKVSILKDAINNPDDFQLEAFIENGEIIIKIKRKES